MRASRDNRFHLRKSAIAGLVVAGCGGGRVLAKLDLESQALGPRVCGKGDAS